MKPHKNITNLELAELLRSVAASYQLQGEETNRFRMIAYQRAADAVEHATSELKDLWDDGKLEEVPGIGKSIAAHLDELFRTGTSKHFGEVMRGLPASMFDLMKIPGVGAKRALRLSRELKISSIAELEKAAKAGKIANLEGFGQESQDDILKAIQESEGMVRRHLLPYATTIASEIIDWMKKSRFVKRVDPLGSLRRWAATVGDIDVAVATNNPKETIEHFAKYPKTQRILEKGERTASILVPGDVQVDLMVQSSDAYGALLQHFTGSKHHNIALREFALKKGLSVSEYGIKETRNKKQVTRKFATEEEFYQYLRLAWIPPELREGGGEIEVASKHQLPKLVQLDQVKADLQIHSSFDIETSHDLGESSMEEMVRKAGELGYEYLAFTEHNPSKSKHTETQIIEILKRKRAAVDQLNYSIIKGVKNRVLKVFNSLEIDILPKGGLPVPETAMKTLDFALVSIHSSFKLSRDEMTKRVLSVLAYPKVKIFAHPTARKLNEREGIELNWPEIFEFCSRNNKWIEINADPMRLDLPDVLVREAVRAGVKLTLGTDAHHQDGLDNMILGASVARRGWAEKDDIINTRGLEEFEKRLNGG